MIKPIGISPIVPLTRLTDRRHEDILQWLTTSRSSEKHNDAQKQRSEDSGEWIFETENFKEWAAQPGTLLWIHGIGRFMSKHLYVELDFPDTFADA